jgi:hypothetical protein
MNIFTATHQPFEAAKARHLRVRVLCVPHPEVRALASLEGLVGDEKEQAPP